MLATRPRALKLHNNRALVARNPVLPNLKLVYYHFFAMLYGLVGTARKLSWSIPRGHSDISVVCEVVIRINYRLFICPFWCSYCQGLALKIRWKINVRSISYHQSRPEKDLNIEKFQAALGYALRRSKEPAGYRWPQNSRKSTDLHQQSQDMIQEFDWSAYRKAEADWRLSQSSGLWSSR